MFKIITIGILLFVFYRLAMGLPLLGGGNSDVLEPKDEIDDDDFVDYEEVE